MAALGLLVASGLALVLAAPAQASAQPNILIIVTDDQRSGMQAMPATRHLFHAQGVRFPNGYVTDPLCCPSRASIMTGRYPHNTGVKSNADHSDIGVGNAAALDQTTTFQRYLDDAGYTTALFGKFLNQWDPAAAPAYFDTFAVVNAVHNNYYRNRVSVGDSAAGVTNTFLSHGYNTTLIRRRAIRFLRSQAERPEPFLLYLATAAPHSAYTPEPKYANDTFGLWPGNPAVTEQNKLDKPAYVQAASATLETGRKIRTKQYRTLESVDGMVSAIYRQLVAQGQADNTLAFFVSDNGYMWGEHGLVGKDVPYIPAVEVPFYMRWPDGPAPGGPPDMRAAANIDIAPTVLDAAGLPIPATMDGRSLLQPWNRPRQYTEHWCNVRRCLFWAAERTDAYHYIEYYDGPDFDTANVAFREYYDLTTDPFELINLLGDGDSANDPDVSAVAADLAADRNCSGGSCP